MKGKFTCFCMALMIACFFAVPAGNAKAANFTIEKYHVDMKVTKQNTYRMEETIEVNFSSKSHGIYRNIPVVNETERTDGRKVRTAAKIQNVKCAGETYEISREGECCRIRLGDEDKEITGDKKYRISYDYVMGNDVLDGEDELYFNIIGTEWETSIKNVSFQIEMPDSFDSDKLGITCGSKQAGNYERVSFRTEGNTIYGELDPSGYLNPYEGVTVRISLPEGYFEKVDNTPILPWIVLLLGIVTLTLAAVFWWRFGRDDPVVETVEFYPPDGLNSVETAFAFYGKTSSKDVTSLIVYLAQKGYLDIREGKKKNDFVLARKKRYDGFKEMERVFLEGLFAKGDEVTNRDLENSFYKTLDTVTAIMNSRENKEKIFYANSINKGWILWLLAGLTCLLAGVVPVKEYDYSLIMGVLCPLSVGLVVMLSSTVLFRRGNIIGRIAGALLLLCVAAAGTYMFIWDALVCAGGLYPAVFLISLLFSFVVMFFNSYMSKRTPYGTEMLGRIGGFRNFLETAEKERLEALVMENPQYFYDILPYTYVLGVSDKWMKKFESVTVEPPTWYTGYHNSVFDLMMFNRFMNATMTEAATSMMSQPTSGGGGFVGGGSGGGGGGSW